MGTRANLLIPVGGGSAKVEVYYIHYGDPNDVMPTLSKMTEKQFKAATKGHGMIRGFDMPALAKTREEFDIPYDDKPKEKVSAHWDRPKEPPRIEDLSDEDSVYWDLGEIEYFYIHNGQEWCWWPSDDFGEDMEATKTLRAALVNRGLRESWLPLREVRGPNAAWVANEISRRGPDDWVASAKRKIERGILGGAVGGCDGLGWGIGMNDPQPAADALSDGMDYVAFTVDKRIPLPIDDDESARILGDMTAEISAWINGSGMIGAVLDKSDNTESMSHRIFVVRAFAGRAGKPKPKRRRRSNPAGIPRWSPHHPSNMRESAGSGEGDMVRRMVIDYTKKQARNSSLPSVKWTRGIQDGFILRVDYGNHVVPQRCETADDVQHELDRIVADVIHAEDPRGVAMEGAKVQYKGLENRVGFPTYRDQDGTLRCSRCCADVDPFGDDDDPEDGYHGCEVCRPNAHGTAMESAAYRSHDGTLRYNRHTPDREGPPALPAPIRKTIDRFNLAASNRGIDRRIWVEVGTHLDWKYAVRSSKLDGSDVKLEGASMNAKDTVIDIKRAAYELGMLSGDQETDVILLHESAGSGGSHFLTEFDRERYEWCKEHARELGLKLGYSPSGGFWIERAGEEGNDRIIFDSKTRASASGNSWNLDLVAEFLNGYESSLRRAAASYNRSAAKCPNCGRSVHDRETSIGCARHHVPGPDDRDGKVALIDLVSRQRREFGDVRAA